MRRCHREFGPTQSATQKPNIRRHQRPGFEPFNCGKAVCVCVCVRSRDRTNSLLLDLLARMNASPPDENPRKPRAEIGFRSSLGDGQSFGVRQKPKAE